MPRFPATFALIAALAAGCVPVPVPIPVVAGMAASSARPLPASSPAFADFDRHFSAFRAANGASPLASNAALDKVAADHAAYLAATGQLTHRDALGNRASQRVRRAGITTCGAGENLAEGYATAQGALAGWQASPGHRANMLSTRYANYGLGRAGRIWVLVMALPCQARAADRPI